VRSDAFMSKAIRHKYLMRARKTVCPMGKNYKIMPIAANDAKEL